MYKIIILPVLVLYSITASAQVYFNKTYRPSVDFNAEGFWTPVFEITNQNEYISIGLTTNNINGQGWMVKTNTNGDTIQTQLFGNLNRNYKPFSALYTEDNKIMILCNAVGDSTLEMDLIKTNTAFNIESIYNFRNDTFSYYASHLVETENGYLIVTGVDYKNSTVLPDACLLFIDKNGNRKWEKIYGGLAYDAFTSAIHTPDKGFLALGTTRSFGAGQRDCYLIKTDSLGNQQWQQTYGTSANNSGWGIIVLNDGNYLLGGGGGYSGGNGWAEQKKINQSGTIIWQKTYNYPGSNDSYIHWVKELADGTIMAVGLTTYAEEGNAGYLQKTDSNGNLLWQQKYNYNENTDLFYNVLPTADGGFLLSGQCANDTTGQDAWLLKVDSLGCPYPNCTVGIEEENKTVAFNLWPNPATEVLNVEVFNTKQTALYIKDMMGKEVYHSTFSEAKIAVDVSQFSKGIYLVEVNTANEVFIKKFSVE